LPVSTARAVIGVAAQNHPVTLGGIEAHGAGGVKLDVRKGRQVGAGGGGGIVAGLNVNVVKAVPVGRFVVGSLAKSCAVSVKVPSPTS
jgi:hypothetical protein